jgi:hypothetical protein
MRVIRMQLDGGKGGLILPAKEKPAILEEVAMFIEELSEGDSVTLTAEKMTGDEYTKLPEFTGW